MDIGIGLNVAIFAALWCFVAQVCLYSTTMFLVDPIISGLVTGIIVGNIPLGLAIGGTLELMSLGLWQYGGASIPDFMTGAVIGTAFASLSTGSMNEAIVAGIAVAVPIAMFMSQADMIAYTLNLPLLHAADKYIDQKNEKGIGRMHLLGALPIGLTRALPVFFAIWLGSGPVTNLINNIPTWLTNGLNTMGGMLPIVGFGILLTFLPLKKYWAFFVVGFVLFAYLNVPLVGIALMVMAVVALYFSIKSRDADGEVQNVKITDESGGQKNSPVVRKDLAKAMWRHNTTMELSWNYERMQALGFTWSILPVLKKVYPDKDEFFAALKRHMVFYNTNVIYGSPTIFGAVCALEENKEPEIADSLKMSLMGPFAGIGDTLVSVLMKPIFAIVASSMALAGNTMGAWLMMLLNVIWFVSKFPGFWFGYQKGLTLVQQLSSGIVGRLTDAAGALALGVMGGFIPSILAGVTTPLQVARDVMVEGEQVSQIVKIQDTFDSILPYMIPLLLVYLIYWLMKKKHWKNMQVLILVMVIGIVAGALGIL